MLKLKTAGNGNRCMSRSVKDIYLIAFGIQIGQDMHSASMLTVELIMEVMERRLLPDTQHLQTTNTKTIRRLRCQT